MRSESKPSDGKCEGGRWERWAPQGSPEIARARSHHRPSECPGRGAIVSRASPLEDRFGRPVVVLRAQHLPGTMDLETFEQGFCATLDAVIAHVLARRAAGDPLEGNPLDQYVCLVDTEGASRNNFSLQAVKMMQRMATTRYAERVAKIYVLSPNMVVRTVWGMVKPLLLERTQRNILMVPAGEVAPVLRQLMGDRFEQVLPPGYGGRAPAWPTPQQAETLEDASPVLRIQQHGDVAFQSPLFKVGGGRGARLSLQLWCGHVACRSG